MLKEDISKKKWLFVFTAFIGIVIVFFDPDLKNNLLGLFFATLMALFFAFAQVYSRDLRELNIYLINAFTGLFGFLILLLISIFV